MKKLLLPVFLLLSFSISYGQNDDIKSLTKDQTINEIKAWMKKYAYSSESTEFTVTGCEFSYRYSDEFSGLSVKSTLQVKDIGKVEKVFNDVFIKCKNEAECTRDIVEGQEKEYKSKWLTIGTERGKGFDSEAFWRIEKLIDHLKSFCN